MRIGYGWDSHEFKSGVPLRIGGIAIDHPRGLAGHSDGDVLLHAFTDALLGAVGAGDIGTYFPPSDPQWKGADSSIFVERAMEAVRKAGYRVANADATLILAEPKIVPHARAIQARVAALLGVAIEDVGIKAKTPEGMGTDNAAIAHAVVLLTKGGRAGKRRAVAAKTIPQEEVDAIAEKLIGTVANERRPARKR